MVSVGCASCWFRFCHENPGNQIQGIGSVDFIRRAVKVLGHVVFERVAAFHFIRLQLEAPSMITSKH